MMSRRFLHVSILSVTLCFFAPPSPGQTASGTAKAAPGSFQELVMEIQRLLTELGYQPGTVDGKMGTRTRNAIKRYQSNTGLPVDGHPSHALLEHLRVTTGAEPPASTTSVSTPSAGDTSKRKAAWKGETVVDSLLRIAPSGASASKQRLPEGTSLEIIRRQGAWLEVRVTDGGNEGWVKQVSVRPVTDTASAPSKKKSGGFFASLARGVSRLLGGSSDAPQDQGTVTVGIRGLAPEDLASTVPDPAELDKMEGFRADNDQAFRFAAEEQLTTQTIEYLPAAGTSAETPAASGRRDE